MRNRGAYLHIYARNRLELFANVCGELLLSSSGQHERSLDFRGVHAQCVLVEFRTAGLSSDSLYLRNAQQQLFRLRAYLVGLFERNARHSAYVNGERALVKRRQEIATKSSKDENRRYQQGCRHTQNRLLMLYGSIQRACIHATQLTGHPRLLVVSFLYLST